MNLDNLKVGQFAKVNENVVYRFKLLSNPRPYSFEGIFQVFIHPHLSVWGAWLGDKYSMELLEKPEKKYIDNTIKMLQEHLKENKIDNLTYIENYDILKNYLKSVIVVKKTK